MVPGQVVEGLRDTLLPQRELELDPVAAARPGGPLELEGVHRRGDRLPPFQRDRTRCLLHPLRPGHGVDLPWQMMTRLSSQRILPPAASRAGTVIALSVTLRTV